MITRASRPLASSSSSSGLLRPRMNGACTARRILGVSSISSGEGGGSSSRIRRRQRLGPTAAAASGERAAEREAYERGYAAGLAAAAASAPVPPTLARSAAKGVSWRVFSAVVTVSLAVLIFGKAAFEEAGGVVAASKFAAAEFCLKLSMFVLHERLWGWIDEGDRGRRGGREPWDS
jgi:uncharacterized membrane protein